MEWTQNLLNNTIHKLFVQASRDGMITQYERDIISQVEIDLKRYCDAVDQASEDGIIDVGEKIALNHLLDAISANAHTVATSDGILSRNEVDLLMKLQKLVNKYLVL